VFYISIFTEESFLVYYGQNYYYYFTYQPYCYNCNYRHYQY